MLAQFVQMCQWVLGLGEHYGAELVWSYGVSKAWGGGLVVVSREKVGVGNSEVRVEVNRGGEEEGRRGPGVTA